MEIDGNKQDVMSTNPPEPSLAGAVGRKRQTILAACQGCRRKKVKCDGNRPCGYCTARGLQLNCHFEANEDETHRIAAKRKHNEISQSRDDLQRLFTQISSRRELEAAEIFRRIRRREDPGTILQHLEHGDDVRRRADNSQVTARESLMREVLQSSASVDELLRFVAVEMDESAHELQYPSSSELVQLRHESPQLGVFVAMMKKANSKQPEEPSGETSYSPSLNTSSKGRFAVPGHPWTNLISDEAVTELISMFFNNLWPYWRLLERDLFLEAMRSERLDSVLCSPFLVNAILALASMYSESEAAFATPGNLLGRGRCYHDEAMRLWLEEEAHPSLTNVQGLMLLSLQCSMAGKDRLGEILLSAARHLERELHTPAPAALVKAGTSIVDYSKSRRGVAWCIGLLEVDCVIAHLRPATIWKRKLRVLPPDGLPDVTLLPSSEQWTGYPFEHEPLTLDPTSIWRERCNLEQLVQDSLNALLVRSDELSPSTLLERGQEQIGMIYGWLRALPDSVQWRTAMPVPLFDLHSQYFCTMITLHVIVYTRVSTRVSGGSELLMVASLYESLINHARQATTLLRQYREQYGLKLALPHIVQLASMTSALLLQTMQSRQQSSMSIDAQKKPELAADVRLAFEESFRFLLCTGLQNMLARAIARMLSQTASEMDVDFSPKVHKLLQVMDGAGWTASDVDKLSSTYPNLAMERRPQEGDGMEDLLRRWEGLAPT